MEPKTFYDVIKPLVYFNCFAGMGAYPQPNQSVTTSSLMKIFTVIITAVQWTAIYVTVSSLEQIIHFENASPMALTMYRALLSANSGITVIAPFLIWLQSRVMRDCLRQMLILDDTFQAVLGARNEYRKDYIRLIRQIATIIIVMFFLSIYDSVIALELELQMNIRALFMFLSIAHAVHQPILVMLLLDLNFCTFAGYLGKRFRDINYSLVGLTGKTSTSSPGERLFMISKKVRQLRPGHEVKNTEAESVMNDKHHILRETRKAHLELCKLSQKINSTFGIQNLLSMGISFVMVTGLLYTIYSAFSWDHFVISQLKEVIPSATWTVIYVFKIWTVNHSCWRVSSEAERTGETVYGLLNSSVDKALQKEIQEFGLQMLQNPLRFNACGFFTLNHTFLQGAIGSITTYLVILIQMSNISKSPNSNAPATGNGSEISTK